MHREIQVPTYVVSQWLTHQMLVKISVLLKCWGQPHLCVHHIYIFKPFTIISWYPECWRGPLENFSKSNMAFGGSCFYSSFAKKKKKLFRTPLPAKGIWHFKGSVIYRVESVLQHIRKHFSFITHKLSWEKKCSPNWQWWWVKSFFLHIGIVLC